MLPLGGEKAGQLNGHIVHHEREERLIGVPVGSEESGDEAPDRAGHRAGHEHDHQQQGSLQAVSQIDHAGGGCDAADQNLTLRTDVPKAHLESGGKADADTQQQHGVADGDPASRDAAKCAAPHGGIDF